MASVAQRSSASPLRHSSAKQSSASTLVSQSVRSSAKRPPWQKRWSSGTANTPDSHHRAATAADRTQSAERSSRDAEVAPTRRARRGERAPRREECRLAQLTSQPAMERGTTEEPRDEPNESSGERALLARSRRAHIWHPDAGVRLRLLALGAADGLRLSLSSY